MKVDRCVKSDIEEVNGELFVKVPAPCCSMSDPTGGTSSCWIPREFIEQVTAKWGDEGKADIFLLANLSEVTIIFKVLDLIRFKGGDVLAMVKAVGADIDPLKMLMKVLDSVRPTNGN